MNDTHFTLAHAEKSRVVDNKDQHSGFLHLKAFGKNNRGNFTKYYCVLKDSTLLWYSSQPPIVTQQDSAQEIRFNGSVVSFANSDSDESVQLSQRFSVTPKGALPLSDVLVGYIKEGNDHLLKLYRKDRAFNGHYLIIKTKTEADSRRWRSSIEDAATCSRSGLTAQKRQMENFMGRRLKAQEENLNLATELQALEGTRFAEIHSRDVNVRKLLNDDDKIRLKIRKVEEKIVEYENQINRRLDKCEVIQEYNEELLADIEDLQMQEDSLKAAAEQLQKVVSDFPSISNLLKPDLDKLTSLANGELDAFAGLNEDLKAFLKEQNLEETPEEELDDIV